MKRIIMLIERKLNISLNYKKFKVGDIVKHNWRAKVEINSALKGVSDRLEIIEIEAVRKHGKDQLITYKDLENGTTDSSDCYWLTKY